MQKIRYQALGPMMSGEGSRAFLGLEMSGDSLVRPVVMVWVPPEAAQDPQQVSQIQKETERAVTLEHPNILRVYGLASLDEGLARVVEFADGESLRRVLEVVNKLPLRFAAQVVADAAMGVHFAHLAGNDDGSPLLHGDLRPETLMLSFAGVTKVSGYGALSVAPKEQDGKRVMHRRLYCAPEQIVDGRNAVSVETDVYLLGLLMFECITGEIPFQNDPKFEQAVLNTPLPTERLGNVPTALVPVLERATAKRASDRYPSAIAFRDAVLAATGPLPPQEDFVTYLQGYFPEGHPARAARRGILEAGITEHVRKQGGSPSVVVDRLLAQTPAPVATEAPVAAQLSPVQSTPAQPAQAEAHPAAAPARVSRPREPLPPEPFSDVYPPIRSRKPYVVAGVVVAGALLVLLVNPFRSAPDVTELLRKDHPPLVAEKKPEPAPQKATADSPAREKPEGTPPGDGDPSPLNAAEASPAPPRVTAASTVPPLAFKPAEPSSLSLTVDPPVEVTIDDTPAGRSPINMPLSPGRHLLKLRDTARGINVSRSVVVNAQGKTRHQVSLGKSFVSVNIPPGAVIHLDGQTVGKSSLKDWSIYEGRHHLVVFLGSARWQQDFSVRPSEHMNYDVSATEQP